MKKNDKFDKFDKIEKIASVAKGAGLKEKTSRRRPQGKTKSRLLQIPKEWDDAITKHLLTERLNADGESGDFTFASWVRKAILAQMKKDNIKV